MWRILNGRDVPSHGFTTTTLPLTIDQYVTNCDQSYTILLDLAFIKNNMFDHSWNIGHNTKEKTMRNDPKFVAMGSTPK